MKDERIVEVIEKGLAEARGADPMHGDRINARVALAALRAEGFDIYRPDECKPVYRMSILAGTYGQCDVENAEYRLVPVGGED